MRFIVPIISLTILGLLSLKTNSTGELKNLDPKWTVEKTLKEDIARFSKDVTDYQAAFSSASTAEKLTCLLTFKAKYKQLEMWLNYYQPQYIEDFINGAPLPKSERNAPQLSVLEPKGFQILESELIEEKVNEAKVKTLQADLVLRLKDLIRYSSLFEVQNRHFFEAAHLQINRILSLGVSGFDSPSQQQSIAQNQIALNSIFRYMEFYLPLVDSVFTLKKEKIETRSNALFKELSFEKFDRYALLTEVLDPMKALLVDIQDALGVEYFEMTANLPIAVNFHAKSMFAADYLNVAYFANASPGNLRKEVAALGKRLFHEKKLSGNGQMACVSCHIPELGFADGRAFSMGSMGIEVDRNSPTLMNSIYTKKFFWDGRANQTQQQIEHVIFNENEFGTDYQQMVANLQSDPSYVYDFNQAFGGGNTLTRNNILEALTAYLATVVDHNTRFDQNVRGEIQTLTYQEKEGFNLFMGKAQCGVCHFAPTFNGTVPPYFSDSETEVIGTPDHPNKKVAKLDQDLGRVANRVPWDAAKIYAHSFKTPSVRNVERTGPYMHNGVFQTLEEVVSFYNDGGGIGWGFDLPNQTLPFDQLNLSKKEQRAIIAFLKTLTSEPKEPEN